MSTDLTKMVEEWQDKEWTEERYALGGIFLAFIAEIERNNNLILSLDLQIKTNMEEIEKLKIKTDPTL